VAFSGSLRQESEGEKVGEVIEQRHALLRVVRHARRECHEDKMRVGVIDIHAAAQPARFRRRACPVHTEGLSEIKIAKSTTPRYVTNAA